MSVSPAQQRQRPTPFPLQQPHQRAEPSQPPHRNLIASEAEQLSLRMIARHRNATATVCKTLQTRVLELRGDTNALKRTASDLIRETGKRVRRDFKVLMDGVHVTSCANAERACSAKINAIWKRNSNLTEEHTIMLTQLAEARQRVGEERSGNTRLCSALARAARAQSVRAQEARERLSEVKTQVLAELKAFQELSNKIQAGVAAVSARSSAVGDAAVQTDGRVANDAETQTSNTARISTDASCQTDTGVGSVASSCIKNLVPAASTPAPGLGDFVVQPSAGRVPIVGRVMHILPADESLVRPDDKYQSQAFVQLYERTWRNSPPCSSSSSPLAPASPGGIEYWRHAINQSQIVPLASLQVISMKRGLFGHVITSE